MTILLHIFGEKNFENRPAFGELADKTIVVLFSLNVWSIALFLLKHVD